MSIVIKQNDTRPSVEVQLLDADGVPVNLELCGVMFHMRDLRGSVKINAPCVIVSAAEGRVRYDWQAPDTGTPGTYYVEFEVHSPDASIMTVPNAGYLTITITPELA